MDVRSPVVGWLWIGVLALLTIVALVRPNRWLRVATVVAALLTVLLREQFLPAHVRNVIWGMAQAGAANADFQRGALDTLGFVFATQKFTVAGVLLLGTLALLPGRQKLPQ